MVHDTRATHDEFELRATEYDNCRKSLQTVGQCHRSSLHRLYAVTVADVAFSAKYRQWRVGRTLELVTDRATQPVGHQKYVGLG